MKILKFIWIWFCSEYSC